MKSWKNLVVVLGLVAAVVLPAAAQSASAAVDGTTTATAFRSASTTAAEPCEATWLCLYANTGFNDMRFRTQRQNACWNLSDYGLAYLVGSYVNGLPVYGHFYDFDKAEVWSIRNGGSSSDSTSFYEEYYFCTGTARP